MTCSIDATLECDQCHEWEAYPGVTGKTEARRLGRTNGWTQAEDGNDYCPKCTVDRAGEEDL